VTRLARPCLGSPTTPHCPATTRTGSRCPDCQREVERQRAPRPTTTARTTEERKRRAAVVRAWRAAYGDWCPGWQRDGHWSTDLTADHVTPAAAGGVELSVLCRQCNSSKGARFLPSRGGVLLDTTRQPEPQQWGIA
jgi:5-methylcytosine-specific restriction protein A